MKGERVYFTDGTRTWWWTEKDDDKTLGMPMGLTYDPPPEGAVILERMPWL